MHEGFALLAMALLPLFSWTFCVADTFVPLERHGRGGSVYRLPQATLQAVISLAAVVAVAGIVVTCLAEAGVVHTTPENASLYFLALEAVLIAAYFVLRRKSVRVLPDALVVTPLFGPKRRIAFRDITAIETERPDDFSLADRLVVFEHGTPAATIDASFDIPRILSEITAA
jgi:hypothetical protein